jgi:hypothetical protein
MHSKAGEPQGGVRKSAVAKILAKTRGNLWFKMRAKFLRRREPHPQPQRRTSGVESSVPLEVPSDPSVPSEFSSRFQTLAREFNLDFPHPASDLDTIESLLDVIIQGAGIVGVLQGQNEQLRSQYTQLQDLHDQIQGRFTRYKQLQREADKQLQQAAMRVIYNDVQATSAREGPGAARAELIGILHEMTHMNEELPEELLGEEQLDHWRELRPRAVPSDPPVLVVNDLPRADEGWTGWRAWG